MFKKEIDAAVKVVEVETEAKKLKARNYLFTFQAVLCCQIQNLVKDQKLVVSNKLFVVYKILDLEK
jgi:hypothetical protein